MSASTDPRSTLKKGDYHAPLPGDLRTPCPVVNSLANHGYLPRDGRNAKPEHFQEGLAALGLSWALNKLLTTGTFIVHKHDDHTAPTEVPNTTCIHGGGPLSGLRRPDQVDADGKPIIDLDQIGRHGAVEHDISITRLDIGQGDSLTPQPDLIANLLASSADGKVLTNTDFGKLRHARYEKQVRDNAQLQFGAQEQDVAFAEIALIQGVFGRGVFWRIPVEYARALFEEERFPLKEGWTRRWTPFTLVEFFGLRTIVGRFCGVPLDKPKST